MRKSEELANPNSCLNRADDDELIFVLRGHDVAAPATIRAWNRERVRLRKNRWGDPQLIEAALCADRMQAERNMAIGKEEKNDGKNTNQGTAAVPSGEV